MPTATETMFRQPTPRSPDEWRAAREARGLSVVQMARRSGLNRSTIWRIEHGSPTSPRVQRLVALALLDLAPPDDPQRVLFEEVDR